MRVLSILLCLTLCGPALGQTWLSDSEDVWMLKSLFRRPVSEWSLVLAENRHLLKDEFFEKVEQRIRWGVSEGHHDDAFRFAMVGDLSAEVVGREADFRQDLLALFMSRPALIPINIPENGTTFGRPEFVLVDDERMSRLAPWEAWPRRTRDHQRQRRMLREVFSQRVSDWDANLKKKSWLLTDEFYATLSQVIELERRRGRTERAVLYALLGDRAAWMEKRKLYARLKLGLALRRTPLVIDLRDGSRHRFPERAGAGYSIVPDAPDLGF